MATITPSQLPTLREDAGLYRELDVLEHLRIGLPDGYEIFHEVTWHTVYNGADRHGEIDLVVLSPLGDMLLIEVKAGQVIVREGGLFKRYGKTERDVAQQTRIQFSGMVARLKAAHLHPFVTNCLVLPDYQLDAAEVVSIPRERIIGANEYPNLSTIVQQLLTVTVRSHAVADVEAVRQFLRNEFQVIPSIGNLRDQVKSTSLRLSDGMAEWVPRIQHASNIYLIQATAGSGKTQLALRLLNDAAAGKLNAMYVCFNRPLADMMAQLAPTRTKVTSFHELAVDYYRRQYQDPDFSEQQIFQRITTAYLQDSDSFPAPYDLLIIDEAQDFDPLWINAILQQLKPDGCLYVMVDDAQRLYEREAFDLPDAVTIQCNDNYRSPRAVCQTINALELTTPAIQSKNPYVGEYPQFLQYHDVASLLFQTEHAVNDMLKSGFALHDIIILTGAGLTSSKLFNTSLLGKMSLRKFTNTYNRKGDPVWTTGDLVLETLYRFKGQSAPAVVLTEIDFETFSQQERNKLFVGMTRAQMSLTVILSEQATVRVSSLL